MEVQKPQLRALIPADAADLAHAANDPRIAANLKDVFPHPYTVEDAERFIAFCAAAPETVQLSRAIVWQGRTAGMVSLTFGSDVYARTAEVGYWLAADLWGQGIAAAAVGELCRMAFADLGMERLWAAVFEGNGASCRVLEKCGFTREATLRRAARKNGKTLDVMLYGRWKAEGE